MWQQLVVKYGGSLCQHIFGHPYSTEERGELVHELIFENQYKMLETTLLAKRKGKSASIKTCSLHHQAAYQDKDRQDVPECFNIICKTKDGVVEAIEHKELPIAGCQFHTEEDYNPLGNYLIRKLIAASPNLKKIENEHTGKGEAL